MRNCFPTVLDNVQELIRNCLPTVLGYFQELIRNQDEGQTMVHQATSLGEKVLRNTHSSGREDIKKAMKDIQDDWDRFIKKLTNAKVTVKSESRAAVRAAVRVYY